MLAFSHGLWFSVILDHPGKALGQSVEFGPLFLHVMVHRPLASGMQIQKILGWAQEAVALTCNMYNLMNTEVWVPQTMKFNSSRFWGHTFCSPIESHHLSISSHSRNPKHPSFGSPGKVDVGDILYLMPVILRSTPQVRYSKKISG